MLITSAREQTTVDDIGVSVFANVDENTLDALNRCADEEVLPRSWLISRILQEWAGQHDGSRSDSVTLEQGQHDVLQEIVTQVSSAGHP